MIVKSTVLGIIALLASLGVGEAQSAANISNAVTTGWHLVHAANCYTVSDGATTWLYVFPKEGGFFATNNPGFQTSIAPACQTGNLIGFHVDDSSGAWSQFLTSVNGSTG
jgi:hypothetical protein